MSFSMDGKYVYSGSEDTNLRVWKTKSHEKVGEVSERE